MWGVWAVADTSRPATSTVTNMLVLFHERGTRIPRLRQGWQHTLLASIKVVRLQCLVRI